MLYHDPAAKTHDRFGFVLTMAIALHVAVVLGVGFALVVPKAPLATRLDITLSHYASDKKVEDADFLAQSDQQASGTEKEVKELSTTHVAPINTSLSQPSNTLLETPKQQHTTSDANEVVTSQRSQFVTRLNKSDQQDIAEPLDGEDERLIRQIEIASLQAKLDELQQLYARMPRVRRAASVATRAAEDAEYLYRWQQRIEQIGNQHYPQQARAQQLYGDVQVLVVVNADGSLERAKIIKSSGITILDEAALRIVRLASPFPEFSAELKQTTDQLEIVRTWQFRQNKFSRVSQ